MEKQGGPDSASDKKAPSFKRKVVISFSIFAMFFAFYVGTAVLQTPQFKDLAALNFLSMPVGLFLSLMVFPLSWILIVIYFRMGR